VLQIVRKLVRKLVVPDARPTRAIAKWVARLDHELGDHAVEDDAVVVPAPCVAHEVLHGLGSLLREQPQVHVAQRRVDRRGRCERCRARRRCGRRGGDRLLFARRALVEDIAVAGFRATLSVESGEPWSITGKGVGGSGSEKRNVLGLAAREHVKPLSFEGGAEQCRVTHCLVRQYGVGRCGHRHGGDAPLGGGALVQTEVHPAHGLVLSQQAHDAVRHRVHDCVVARIQKTTKGIAAARCLLLIPNNVGYSTKAPLSSHTALIHAPGTFPSGPGSSSSFSTARRRPNSMSSTLYTAVPACCISWIAASDSSYFLVIFPVKNEKVRICRSGRENVTNDDESGESVIHVGVDFDWKGFAREWDMRTRGRRGAPS